MNVVLMTLLMLVVAVPGHSSANEPDLVAKKFDAQGTQSIDEQVQEPLLIVRNHRLRVISADHKLWAILDAISGQTGITIVNHSGTSDPIISIELRNVTIEEGLHRLLQDYDTFAFYEAGDGSERALKKLWVYRKGVGRGIAALQEKVLASAQNLTDKIIEDPQPEVRARAFAVLLEEQKGTEQETVFRALADSDEGVRERILSKALSKGVKLPPAALRELASADPSEQVSAVALDLMFFDPDFEREELRAIAESALHNESPVVQSKASEIIDRLDTLERVGDDPDLIDGVAASQMSEPDGGPLGIPEEVGPPEE